MAKTSIHTAAGLGGTSYGNVTITGGNGSAIVYSTATAANPIWTTATTQPFYTKQPKVKITDQDIEIDGLSLRETMQIIRDELMIPTRIKRNAVLEQEFDELKACADRYRELEQKFLEQKQMWATLKHTDK
jgi:hypothetical protein